jgi:hypothetical protein
VHIGTRHNLGSVDGIRSALEEVESVWRLLQQRLKAVKRGGEVEEADLEGSSRDELNEDDEDDDDDEDEEDEDKDKEIEDAEELFEGFSN